MGQLRPYGRTRNSDVADWIGIETGFLIREQQAEEAVLMMDNAKQRMIEETTKRRDDAVALLKSLLDAKSISERNLEAIQQPDLIKQFTGRSSMDNAIASTRRLIDSFNRVLDDLRRNLSEEDLRLIGRLEPSLSV